MSAVSVYGKVEINYIKMGCIQAEKATSGLLQVVRTCTSKARKGRFVSQVYYKNEDRRYF